MGKETVTILETSLDDLNPLFFENLFARLFQAGALDVTLTPLLMKKQRPGYQLTVLAKKEKTNNLIRTIFAETTTFGIRIREEKRIVLERRIRKIKTRYGEIRCKVGYYQEEVMSISPEYEDCKNTAAKLKIPLKVIYEEVKVIGAGKL